MEQSVAQSFSKCLAITMAKLINADVTNGVKFSYKVPEGLCLHSNGSSKLAASSTLAIFDELSTYAFNVQDRNHRSGVSIHLTTELLSEIRPGELVVVDCKAEKIGKTVGFCTMKMLDAQGNLVAQGKHIKYLPMGYMWNIFTNPLVLSSCLNFYDHNRKFLDNSRLGKFIQNLIVGGRNKSRNMREIKSDGVAAIFTGLDMSCIQESVAAPCSTPQRLYELPSNASLNNFVGRLHGGALAMAIERAVSLHVDRSSVTVSNIQALEVRYLSAMKVGGLVIAVVIFFI